MGVKLGRRIDARDKPGQPESRKLVALPRRGEVGKDEDEVHIVVRDVVMIA